MSRPAPGAAVATAALLLSACSASPPSDWPSAPAEPTASVSASTSGQATDPTAEAWQVPPRLPGELARVEFHHRGGVTIAHQVAPVRPGVRYAVRLACRSLQPAAGADLQVGYRIVAPTAGSGLKPLTSGALGCTGQAGTNTALVGTESVTSVSVELEGPFEGVADAYAVVVPE